MKFARYIRCLFFSLSAYGMTLTSFDSCYVVLCCYVQCHSAGNWFQPRQKPHHLRRIKRIPHWMKLYYFHNNMFWVIWFFLHFAVNIILFVEATVRHWNLVSKECLPKVACSVQYLAYDCGYALSTYIQGAAVAIARGCGSCLNFNPVFVLVLMFRHLLSWIRPTRLYFLFPVDNAIKFHKLVGWTIFFFSCIHTLAHIVNFSKKSKKSM